jgi:hypothetical protein
LSRSTRALPRLFSSSSLPPYVVLTKALHPPPFPRRCRSVDWRMLESWPGGMLSSQQRYILRSRRRAGGDPSIGECWRASHGECISQPPLPRRAPSQHAADHARELASPRGCCLLCSCCCARAPREKKKCCTLCCLSLGGHSSRSAAAVRRTVQGALHGALPAGCRLQAGGGRSAGRCVGRVEQEPQPRTLVHTSGGAAGSVAARAAGARSWARSGAGRSAPLHKGALPPCTRAGAGRRAALTGAEARGWKRAQEARWARASRARCKERSSG